MAVVFPLRRAWLAGVAVVALLGGCAGPHVRKIGQVSERTLIHVQVGTTFDVYIPSIEFEADNGDE